MFSNEPRCLYQKNQLMEVICQLRFPEILSIGVRVPADFQDAIRADFPRYSARKEVPAPRVTGAPGNFKLEEHPGTVNYQFMSEDGAWRINLSPTFISLACTRYTCWEDFAQRLDQPLAAFIRIYRPAYFERVGLRYVNIFSRQALDLTGVPFRSLFAPAYLGILSDENVVEQTTTCCNTDVELAIRGGCRLKLHSGLGMVNRGKQQDPEVKFIFDQDLFMPGKVPVNLSAGAMETLHSQADSIFRGAITDTLHEAMGPEKV